MKPFGTVVVVEARRAGRVSFGVWVNPELPDLLLLGRWSLLRDIIDGSEVLLIPGLGERVKSDENRRQ
jgi:hypothetical protein